MHSSLPIEDLCQVVAQGGKRGLAFFCRGQVGAAPDEHNLHLVRAGRALHDVACNRARYTMLAGCAYLVELLCKPFALPLAYMHRDSSERLAIIRRWHMPARRISAQAARSLPSIVVYTFGLNNRQMANMYYGEFS